jgi:HK97 family phage prohead protease
MPYSIIHSHPDCLKESGETGQYQVGGHAVVKDDDGSLIGCHKTHKSAQDQITALNIAEAEENEATIEAEHRAVDRKPPKFMQENAQRGLDNLNKAGDGLTDKTKREARSMANGEDVSIDKIVRMGAWHKRHLSDLDREKSNPNDPDTWRASDVAFLLWGSNPWTNPTQAGDWADRKVAQLISEGALEPRAKKETSIKAKKEKKKRYKLMDKIDKAVAISQTIDMQKRNTILKEMDRQTENRSFTFSAVEQRNDDDKDTLLFTGYASVFNKGYGVRDQRGQYTQTIKPGAFKKTLKEQDDVRFLVNHDGIPLARTSSGTLELEEDDYGLFVKAELDPSNPTVAEIASAMKRGDLNEMSFAFAAIRDDFDAREENREVTEARLFDVSVVTYPANPWAGAKLRGVELDNLHKELVEARNGEQATEVLESFINKVAESDDVDKKRSNPKVELLKMQLERDNIRK